MFFSASNSAKLRLDANTEDVEKLVLSPKNK
jgi:hypothetical protein